MKVACPAHNLTDFGRLGGLYRRTHRRLALGSAWTMPERVVAAYSQPAYSYSKL